MKVWITKYALTKGVLEIDGRIVGSKKTYIENTVSDYWYSPAEWHTTEAAAIAKAEQMRILKIASLKKQIAKLEKMTFTPKDPK